MGIGLLPSETDRRTLVPLGVLAASAGALCVAYVAEYGFGLEPCRLCLYQRVPYALTGALAAVALVTPGWRWRTLAVAAAGVVFLAGAGLAFYHVGVEQHWWSTAACGGGLADAMTAEQFLAQLRRAPPKACDEVEWTLFGISMSGYNLAASAALGAGTLAGALRLARTS